MTEIQNNLFGFKWPTRVDMPLNKTQTQTSLFGFIDEILECGSNEPGSSSSGTLGSVELLLRAPELELRQQMKFRVIPRIGLGIRASL